MSECLHHRQVAAGIWSIVVRLDQSSTLPSTGSLQGFLPKDRPRVPALLERDGRLHAVSPRDPSYSLLLTRNGSSDVPWRVTSCRRKEPVGHREYDMLHSSGPTQNALAEIAGDMQLVQREGRRPSPPLFPAMGYRHYPSACL